MSRLTLERRPKFGPGEIRNVGTSFTIDGPATITVVEVRGGKIVRIMIDAPTTTLIVRDDCNPQKLKDLQT